MGFLSIFLLGLPLDGNIPAPPSEMRPINFEEAVIPTQLILTWLTIYCYWIIKLVRNAKFVLEHNWLPTSLQALFALYAASSIWSPTDSGAATGIIQNLGLLAFAIVLSIEFKNSPEKPFRIMQFGSGANLIINIVAIIITPESTISFDGRWAGVVANPNYLGALSVLCILSALAGNALKKQNVLLLLFFVSISMLTLWNSGSLTSQVATFGSILFASITAIQRIKKTERLPAIIVLFSLGTVALWLTISNLESLLSAVGKDSGATGRTVIWLSAIELIKEKPMIGHGAGADTLNTNALSWATHFHNGYLTIAVTTGLAGLTLFLLFIRDYLALTKKIRNRRFSNANHLVIIATAIYCLTESPVFLARNPIWVLLLISGSLFFLVTHHQKALPLQRRKNLSDITTE